MPLFHECVSKHNHHFMGIQTLVINGDAQECQQKLDDFMKSPDNGNVVIYDIKVSSNPATMGIVVMYGTFSKKREDYGNSYNNHEQDRFSREREFNGNRGNNSYRQRSYNRQD